MTHRNYVVGAECRHLLQEAAQKHMFLNVTNQHDKRWYVYKSSFLALQSNRIIIAMPIPDQQDCYLEPAPGQTIAISFKKGYHKCLFTTRIIEQTQYQLDSDDTIPVISALCPTQIEKIQRRTYNRAVAPAGDPVTVTFWASDASINANKWRGKLYDLSAGGLGLTMLQPEMPEIPEGTQVELCFVPLPGQEPLQLQARFRHATGMPETGRIMLGFQTLGLEMDETGRSLLRRIGRIVNVYKRQSKNINIRS